MVVAEFNVVGVTRFKAKANSPPIVGRYRVLSSSITSQCVQTVAWRNAEILDPHGGVDQFQPACGSYRHIRRNTTALPVRYSCCVCLSANVLITEQVYNVTCNVTTDGAIDDQSQQKSACNGLSVFLGFFKKWVSCT